MQLWILVVLQNGLGLGLSCMIKPQTHQMQTSLSQNSREIHQLSILQNKLLLPFTQILLGNPMCP